jgi:hypothetical protein
MFDFLRALGLHPMDWDHALKQARSKGANPYVGDTSVAYFEISGGLFCFKHDSAGRTGFVLLLRL